MPHIDGLSEVHRSKTIKKTARMARATPKVFFFHWAMIVLSLYSSSSTSIPASYTRAQCPAGIIDVMDKCRCRQSSVGSYVHCELEGASYRRLPVMGQVNATVRRLTLENATVEEVPRRVFADIFVSTYTFITISTIYSTGEP